MRSSQDYDNVTWNIKRHIAWKEQRRINCQTDIRWMERAQLDRWQVSALQMGTDLQTEITFNFKLRILRIRNGVCADFLSSELNHVRINSTSAKQQMVESSSELKIEHATATQRNVSRPDKYRITFFI